MMKKLRLLLIALTVMLTQQLNAHARAPYGSGRGAPDGAPQKTIWPAGQAGMAGRPKMGQDSVRIKDLIENPLRYLDLYKTYENIRKWLGSHAPSPSPSH